MTEYRYITTDRLEIGYLEWNPQGANDPHQTRSLQQARNYLPLVHGHTARQ